MLRGVWVRIALFVMTLAIALPATLLALWVPRSGDRIMRAGRLWSRALLAACGAQVRYHGLDSSELPRPCIFIANHQSMVDVWVMFGIIPASTRFVAKQELFRIPVFGWALAAAGCIPIDRGNRAEAIQSLSQAAERILAGSSVVLYPEGSRSKDGSLQPFKKGAFHLAVQAGVPVVPVAIVGSFQVMSPGTWRVRPGIVDVYVDTPLDAAAYRPDDHDGLRADVRSRIASRFPT